MPNENIGGISISVAVDFSALQQQFDQLNRMAQTAGQQMAAAFSAGAEATDALTASLARVATAETEVSAATASMATQFAAASEASSGMGTSLQSVGGSLSSLLGAGVVLSGISAGIVSAGENALQTAGKFEQWQVSFTRLLGSAEAAKSMLDDLVQFAIKTPFEIPGVVDNAQKLMGFGFAAQQVIPILTTLGDAVSGLGKGAASLNSLTLAFGEMEAKGVVQLRQLNMLTTQGIPAIEMLAQAYGKSTQEMTDMISKKLVPAAQAIPILLEGINQKFGGMMEAQSETFLGMMSNLADAATKTANAIGQQLLPTFKELAADGFTILNSIQQLAQKFAELPAPVQQAAFAVAALAAAAGPLVLALGALGFALTSIGASLPVLVPLAGIIGGIVAAIALFHITDIDQDFLNLFTDVRDGFSGLKDLVSDFTNALGEASKAWGSMSVEAKAAITSLVPGLQNILDLLGQINRATTGLTLKQAILDAIPPLDNLKTILQLASSALEYLSGHYNSMDAAIKAVNTSMTQNTEALRSATGALSQTDNATKAAIDSAARLYTQEQLLSDQLPRATKAVKDHATAWNDAVEHGFKPAGPVFEGLNKLLSEMSGNMRISQQAVVDATTGETAYVGVVESLTDAQTKAYTRLQQLYDLRSKWIEQGIATNTINKQIKAAEDDFVKSMETGIDAIGKHNAALKQKQDTERDGIASADSLANAHRGLADSMIKSASDIVASIADEQKAFEKARDVVADLTNKQDGTRAMSLALAQALEQMQRAAAAAGVDTETLANASRDAQHAIDATKTSADSATDSFKEMASAADELSAALDKAGNNQFNVTFSATGGPGLSSPGGNIVNFDPNIAKQIQDQEQKQQEWTAALAQATSDLEAGGLSWKQATNEIKKLSGAANYSASALNTLVQNYLSGGSTGSTSGGSSTSGTVSSTNPITQALIDAQNAYNSALAGVKMTLYGDGGSTGVLDPETQANLAKLSDALQEATLNYLNQGHAFAALNPTVTQATTDLSNLSSAVGDVSTAASTATNALGSSLLDVTNAAAVAAQAVSAATSQVEAQGALVGQLMNSIGGQDTSLPSVPTGASSGPEAGGAFTSPLVGQQFAPQGTNISFTINNPVVTSASQADSMMSQAITQLRQKGLKL